MIRIKEDWLKILFVFLLFIFIDGIIKDFINYVETKEAIKAGLIQKVELIDDYRYKIIWVKPIEKLEK